MLQTTRQSSLRTPTSLSSLLSCPLTCPSTILKNTQEENAAVKTADTTTDKTADTTTDKTTADTVEPVVQAEDTGRPTGDQAEDNNSEGLARSPAIRVQAAGSQAGLLARPARWRASLMLRHQINSHPFTQQTAK